MLNKKYLYLFWFLVVLGLAGCASQQDVGSTRASLATGSSGATYTEKAAGLSLADVRGASCPSDDRWESLAWAKIIPLANACVKAANWTQVEKIGDFLAKRAYLTPWGAYYLALAAESRRDFSRAFWMLELAMKKDPAQGIFHYEMGRIHWEMGADTLAIKSLKAASDRNPSLTEAHAVLGQIALSRNNVAEAKGYLKLALSNAPEHFPSLMAMAQVHANAKEWAEANILLNRAVSSNPMSTKARLAIARIQEEHLKNLNNALSSYRLIKQLVAARKLDEAPSLNLDEKILSVQASMKQAENAAKMTSRQPSADGKVAK